MYCTRCGTVLAGGAAFCSACGQRMTLPATAGPPRPGPSFDSSPGPPVSGPPTGSTGPRAAAPPPIVYYTAAPVMPYSPYAGFWLRFVAYLIDSAVLTFGLGIFIIAAIAILGLGFFRGLGQDIDRGNSVITVVLVMVLCLAALVFTAGAWLYYAWMESSATQGTLGKMALGLIVADMQGRRVTFGRATGRFFAKMITGMIPFLIGYIMAGFTEKKQALHDMIASCVVLRRV
jgi:uncharacterized RDD family membrane protein YckC